LKTFLHTFVLRSALPIHRPALWLGALALVCSPLHAKKPVEGAWEAICVTPVNSVEDTNPGGIINSKWVFDGAGHIAIMQPDQSTVSPDGVATYSLKHGELQLIFKDGSRRYLNDIQFPTRQTMRMPKNSGGYTLFRRIPSASTLLEPRSLQRVFEGDVEPGHECDEETKYDQQDYASLPLAERLLGTWEVIMYRDLSQHGIPPYGFGNDLCVIDNTTLIVHSAYDGTDYRTSYTLKDGAIRTDDLVMTPTFNQWSQLILTNEGGGKLYLKRLSRSTSKPYPKPTLKVVWIGTVDDKESKAP
jgi:hypothetical protein